MIWPMLLSLLISPEVPICHTDAGIVVVSALVSIILITANVTNMVALANVDN